MIAMAKTINLMTDVHGQVWVRERKFTTQAVTGRLLDEYHHLQPKVEDFK